MRLYLDGAEAGSAPFTGMLLVRRQTLARGNSR
jgi:hypothetical protein